MRNKLVKNFLYQASYQVLLIILPIITIPIVSGALGPSGIGQYNYINSVAAYFILVAGLGMANYGVREISIVRDSREKLSRKFWELQGFNLFCSFGAFLVYFIFSLFTNQILLYLITSLSVLSCVFDITWFFAGIEDFKVITIRNFVIKVVSFILIVLLVKSKSDLWIYFLITSLGTLLAELSMWGTIRHYISWVRVSLKDCFKHLKPALTFFVAKIAVTLYQNTTKTILGLMSTMAVVGYYSNAFSLILMSANLINAMNTIMIPRMSNLFGKNDERTMIKVLQKSIYLQMYFTVAITFGIILVTDKLVPWFFGPQFSILKSIIPLLAPVVITQSLQMSIASQYLIPRKDMREYNISIFIGAGITVLTTVVMIPVMGIFGAVIGMNLGYLLVSIRRVYVLVKETEFVFEYRTFLKYVFSGTVMLIIVKMITISMAPSVFTTLLQVVLGVVIYVTCTFLTRVDPLSSFFISEHGSK